MKLTEITIIPLTEEELREAMNLDFVNLYSTYGSWFHPQKAEPIYVTRPQGHPAAAAPLVKDATDENTIHQTMMQQGWVRAVHNKMQSFVMTGTVEALRGILPKLAELRNAVNRIVIEIEDCSGEQGCQAQMTRKYEMPTQWSAMKQALN